MCISKSTAVFLDNNSHQSIYFCIILIWKWWHFPSMLSRQVINWFCWHSRACLSEPWMPPSVSFGLCIVGYFFNCPIIHFRVTFLCPCRLFSKSTQLIPMFHCYLLRIWPDRFCIIIIFILLFSFFKICNNTSETNIEKVQLELTKIGNEIVNIWPDWSGAKARTWNVGEAGWRTGNYVALSFVVVFCGTS